MSGDTPAPRGVSLLRSSLLVGALHGLSRVLGLGRDIGVAVVFGVGPGTDVFFVGLSMAQLLRIEGPIAQALVKRFNDVGASVRGRRRARALGARLAGVAMLISAPPIALALAAPVAIVALFGAGFLVDPLRRDMALNWLPLAFCYLLPALLIAVASQQQNARSRFAAPAMTPALFNIGLIALMAWLYLGERIDIGVMMLSIPLLGGAQYLFHLWRLGRIGELAAPRFDFRDADFRATLALAGPALLVALGVQAAVPINNLIASFLPTGNISWFNLANRVAILPVGLIGVAVATALMPTLSTRHRTADAAGFDRVLRLGMRYIWLLGLPAAAGLWLLADLIALTLFQYGRLGVDDAGAIAAILRALALGAPASMMISVLSTGFFARADMLAPLRIALWLLVLGLPLKAAAVIWAHNRFDAGIVGLAAGISVIAWINVGWLAVRLRREALLRVELADVARLALRLGLSLGAMIAALVVADAGVDAASLSQSRRVVELLLAVGGGVLIYLGCARLLGERVQQPSQA